jgi:hypothetical protein
VSRSPRRKSGRPYQPYPQRRSNWGAKLLIVFVGLALLIGAIAIAFGGITPPQ